MNDSIVIVSTNWIGDVIMSLPAVQIFRAETPDVSITVLAKPCVKAVWEMCPAVDFVETMENPFVTARRLKAAHFSAAYIFPNSFRSAFIPFLARIPARIGLRGKWRRLMLTGTIALPNGHQQFEPMNILGVQGDPPPPELAVPERDIQAVKEKIKTAGNECLSQIITILPGAARGPAKRWPAENFAAVAKRLQAELNAQLILAGGPGDRPVCEEIASSAGGGILNFAGETTIAEWAALLKISRCAVSNDSGGMHLAAAVGTPVVAVFGITDPAKTGPLGTAAILQKSELKTRDIARNSEAAGRALAAITPAEVFNAVREQLTG
ncbi:MAG: lipopolysaccharide heptosyltransferase II [Kiritimatiellales bacterium]